ncbi:MAG: glycosyltransferase family 39 protein [bacterium]|nr:glycosyltransferase family 39 protein [bacterium]
MSIKNDSLTMDELSHLPAGYSYLTQKDMRINPEHPPLIKDLAAIPLLFIPNINFPSDVKAWKDDINGQWDFGNAFLFHSDNPAQIMIFWGRIPMILILILLGFYVFKATKEFFGNKACLLALFLFSFSPTFLAHGRLVTTDVGAAAGALIATYYFIKALQNGSKKSIIIAGVVFGLAELAKFSLILLIPLFFLLALVWWLTKSGKLLPTLKILIMVFIIGYLALWPVYQYHTWNYPAERQARDTKLLLSSFGSRPLADSVVWMSDKPILRPYAQYLLGLSMVLQRAVGGNTTYFMGEVSASGWKTYFPIVYFIKETLSFHILTLVALLYAIWLRKKPSFVIFSLLSFIAIYWGFSLKSNLNIGVRHLLPTIPFAIILVSAATVRWLKAPFLKAKYLFLAALIIWQTVSVASVFPSFLAYFNEAVGGPNKGYLYTVDSNMDWGQDLKRLDQWLDKNNISTIYLDYFGGSDTQYYLKDKYSPWWGDRDKKELPKGSYLAVSATFLQGGRGNPVPGFTSSAGFYNWLNDYKPVAKIGYSIFVYRID